ncbi:MAG: hypothetical protein RIE24_13130 [Silicimonas sp.]
MTGNFFNGLTRGLTAYADRHARMDQIRALNAKTDDELLAMGLTRADIPRHVYRDIFFV